LRILALDLGTRTGWALFDNGETQSGTWRLATPKEIKAQAAAKRERCCDIRAGRLRSLIEGVGPVDRIYFEDVQFVGSVMQVQLWSSLRAMLWLEACKTMAPRVVAVPVGTLKKFAGKGNADKAYMARAAAARGFFKSEADDNEVDAWLLLQFAIQTDNTI